MSLPLEVWLSIAAASPALGALIVSLAALWIQAKTAEKVTDIHLQINGRMDKLLELARAAAIAEGNARYAAGVADGKVLGGPDAPPTV